MRVIPPSTESSKASNSRIASIDMLRGLAILGMALSGVLPWGTLPAWMYHAQLPPPEMKFNAEVPGITWVDWVFPFFLFALGAAIPLNLSKKLDQVKSWRSLIPDILRRYGLLLAFAYLSQHLRPLSINSSPDQSTWMLALLLFLATFLAFVRLPESWSVSHRNCFNLTGWMILIAALISLPAPDGQLFYFLNTRVDIILFVLANVSLSGTIIWVLTRNSPQTRWAITAIITTAFIAKGFDGPIKELWNFNPLPWFWQNESHKYLLIVLPATICGEALLNHSKFKQPLEHTPGAEWTVTVTAIFSLVSITAALFLREIEFALFCAIITGALGSLIASRACHFSPGMKSMILLAALLVIIGVILDPTAGGIKKDPANLSYFFTLTGLAFWLTIAFTNLSKYSFIERALSPLTLTGMNPLLGYVAITNFVPAVIRLTQLHSLVGNQGWTPWQFAGYGLFQTLIVALVCIIASRSKLFLRA
jgi:predicted acyltransferase